MVKKASPASGNKPAGTSRKKATSAEAATPQVGGWKLGAAANAGNGPTTAEELEHEAGFTTDVASGKPPAQPEQDSESEAGDVQQEDGGRRAGDGHSPSNDASDASAVNLTNMTSDLVKGVEALERLAEEIGALRDDAKEFMAELKSKGYSTKTIRQVMRRRAMDPDKRKEEDALLDLYEEALRGA